MHWCFVDGCHHFVLSVQILNDKSRPVLHLDNEQALVTKRPLAVLKMAPAVVQCALTSVLPLKAFPTNSSVCSSKALIFSGVGGAYDRPVCVSRTDRLIRQK